MNKVGDKCSKWQKISAGLFKAPFLVLYFSTFSSAISFFLLKLLHYASMKMTILCILWTKNSNVVISRLRHDFAIISEWLYEN